MSEHSIMVDINDPRTAKIAEAMANKTCKKILDALAEKEEMSESEISSRIEMPLNTIGYNIKKLVEAGLVDKTGGFLWSVKGKRIIKYKLSNKRIVISPKRLISNSIIAIFGILILGSLIALLTFQQENIVDNKIKSFSSYDELKKFIEEHSQQDLFYSRGNDIVTSSIAKAEAGISNNAGQRADDYSKTNVQLEGIDEPDIVKNDGKYIYFAKGNKIAILDAYPAEKMEKISEIIINGSYVKNILIYQDKLIVFGEQSVYYNECDGDICLVSSDNKIKQESMIIAPREFNRQKSFVYIYDISNRSLPKLIKNILYEGYYQEARLIEDDLYVIGNANIGFNDIILPVYSVDGIEKKISPEEVYYNDIYDSGFVFTQIFSVSLDDEKIENKVYLTGASNTLYVSEKNIYLTSDKRVSSLIYQEKMINEIVLPLLPENEKEKIKNITVDKNFRKEFNKIGEILREYSDSLKGKEKEDFDSKLLEKMNEFYIEMQREQDKTIIHKIKIDEGEISYLGKGEVYGRPLNQFSLDEYDRNLRIATTISNFRDKNSNNIYILNEELEIIGKLENLAKGERIYSVRFMGEKMYMVTFKQIDPLFVIDLKDVKNPKVLGYLKIPGFSNYLHPYDENHVIGIGKDTFESGDRALQQGLKISLFDVSDVENPKEKAKLIIGDRGSDSYALYEHKSFLFDKKMNLLVLPVLLAEINMSNVKDENLEWVHGEPVWQGAYIFNINSEGINIRGKITHFDNFSDENKWRFHDSRFQVQRSLYMNNVLYTLSESALKANRIDNLEEIKKVEFDFKENNVVYSVEPK